MICYVPVFTGFSLKSPHVYSQNFFVLADFIILYIQSYVYTVMCGNTWQKLEEHGNVREGLIKYYKHLLSLFCADT